MKAKLWDFATTALLSTLGLLLLYMAGFLLGAIAIVSHLFWSYLWALND